MISSHFDSIDIVLQNFIPLCSILYVTCVVEAAGVPAVCG